MSNRRALLPEGVDGVYHVISRVVDRDMKFGEHEKQVFLMMMRAYAGFCGVRLISWVVMSNHFHILVEVPPVDREKMPAEEVFRRLGLIWRPAAVQEARDLYETMQTEWEKREFLDKHTRRMGDLRKFMQSLKQQYTQWFNRVHERTGTLWECRYHSVIVEGAVMDDSGYSGLSHAARVVAAYIDLNPVRAVMVEDPADYRWSSYGAAVGGDQVARDGLERLWSQGEKRSLASHRLMIFEEGSEERVSEADEERSKRVGIALEKVVEVKVRRGRMPLGQVLRLRVRYMTAGGVIGSEAFVKQVYEGAKDVLGGRGRKRKRHGGVPMRHGDWGGLYALRDLRRPCE